MYVYSFSATILFIIIMQTQSVIQEVATSEKSMGEHECCDLFLSTVFNILKEELIKRSPKGKRIGELLECIQDLDHSTIISIASLLISELNKCIECGNKHRLPSVLHVAIWSAFHKLRVQENIQLAWTTFIN